MSRPLFIAFTGPASSGKTTLVNHLSDIFSLNYNVYTVNEIVRSVLKEWGLTLEELLAKPNEFYKFQSECLTRQIETENQLLQSDYDIVLLDRSVHDYFVYAALGLPPHMYDKYRQQFKDVTSNYDMLIYCEPLEFVDDGIRTRIYIERGEIGLFQMMVKPYTTHVLDKQLHWQRIKQVLKWFGDLNGNK